MSLPINGNQGFNRVQDSAAVGIQDLNVSNLKAANLTAGNFNLNGYSTVFGYVPTSFATAASGTVLALANSPRQSSVTDSNALVLPKGAIFVRYILTNNGTTIAGTGATFTVNTSTTLGGNGGATIASAVTLANTNAGYAASITPGVVNGAGQKYVSVTTGGANVTSGDLAVGVTYLVGPGLA